MGRPIPSYVTEEDVKLQNKLSALKAQTQAYDEPMVLENWVLEGSRELFSRLKVL